MWYVRYIDRSTSIIILLLLDFYYYFCFPKSRKKVRVGEFLRIGSGYGKHEPFFFSLSSYFIYLPLCLQKQLAMRFWPKPSWPLTARANLCYWSVDEETWRLTLMKHVQARDSAVLLIWFRLHDRHFLLPPCLAEHYLVGSNRHLS